MNLGIRTQRSIGLITDIITFSVGKTQCLDLGLLRPSEQPSSRSGKQRLVAPVGGHGDGATFEGGVLTVFDLTCLVPVHWSWGNS